MNTVIAIAIGVSAEGKGIIFNYWNIFEKNNILDQQA
jgi:hypothetical protein